MDWINSIPQWQRDIVATYRKSLSAGCNHRQRLHSIDAELYAALRTFVSARAGSKTEVDENGLPVSVAPPESTILTNALDLCAYLCAVYAFNQPMIGVPDLPDAMHVTTAIKDKLTRDANFGNWMLEMVKVITNAVFYNFSPGEVRLTADKSIRIRALDPYNVFYDAAVSPENVGKDGMFAGYTDLQTAAQLYRTLRTVSEQYLTSTAAAVLVGFDDLITYRDLVSGSNSGGGMAHSESMVMQQIIHAITSYTGGSERSVASGMSSAVVNWDMFFAGTGGNKDKTDRSDYCVEVTTYYRRGLPEWFGLDKKVYGRYDSSKTQLPVFKFTIVSHTFLVAVEPVSESHGLIPIIFGQTNVSTAVGLPLAFTELLMPVQAFSDKMSMARVSSLRRVLSSRGLYDDKAIDPQSISNMSSTAQIRVNGHSLSEKNRSIGDVYQPMPFDASGASYLLGALGDSATYAERISGNNAAMQGGHIPGNRVASEAARVNQMGEGRFRVYAMIFQQTFLSSLKFIIRNNLQDCVDTLTYYDPKTRRLAAVTLSEYISNEYEFDMSDGLLPSTKVASPDAVSAILATVTQIPELRYMKDLGIMVSMLAKAAGVEGFDRIPPPSQATMSAMTQAQPPQPQQATGQTAQNQPSPSKTGK